MVLKPLAFDYFQLPIAYILAYPVVIVYEIGLIQTKVAVVIVEFIALAKSNPLPLQDTKRFGSLTSNKLLGNDSSKTPAHRYTEP